METIKYKKKFGDKKDGRLIKGDELDTNHYIMPFCWPNRTDNEAFFLETIDLTNVNKFLLEKNEGKTIGRYSLFMVFLAAFGKTFLNRPKMNRFYRNKHLYERYRVSIGFIVKKTMSDEGEEALARVYVEPDDTFETLSEKVRNIITKCRKESLDKTSDDIRILMKFPHFIGKLFMWFLRLWDRHTSIPEAISASDLFFTSIVFTHLGSINLHAGYHHLSNWGTNSFFTTLGEKKIRPFYNKHGEVELKDSIDLGMTIDERIADGFYFSKSIRLMKKYLENPEMLESKFKEENIEGA